MSSGVKISYQGVFPRRKFILLKDGKTWEKTLMEWATYCDAGSVIRARAITAMSEYFDLTTEETEALDNELSKADL